jgi:hypothetical protein
MLLPAIDWRLPLTDWSAEPFFWSKDWFCCFFVIALPPVASPPMPWRRGIVPHFEASRRGTRKGQNTVIPVHRLRVDSGRSAQHGGVPQGRRPIKPTMEGTRE